MSKPQGTDHALGAVRLANVIERTRTVSEAYAKMALLLADNALEPRLQGRLATLESVRELYVGLQSILSMRRIEARSRKASAF
jgi:hypothetical protein